MRTIVVGATGALGFEICQRLRARGRKVLAIHRKPSSPLLGPLERLGCETLRCDIRKPGALAALARQDSDLILTPILTTSGPALRALPPAAISRAVLFSSNNVALGANCALYAGIRAEEAALEQHGCDHVIVRPTMIYGHPNDGNLSRVMRLARRYPIVPVPGYGQVRCQPIHIDDLADLAVEALTSAAMPGTVVAAGPAPLTMDTLMHKIARAAGPARIVLPVPLWMLRLAARFVHLPLDAAQLSRARKDRIQADVPDVPGWHPQVSIDEGLNRLARALDGARSRPHMDQAYRQASGGFHVGHTGHSVRHR